MTVATPSPATDLIVKKQETQAAVIEQATTFVTSATQGVDNAIKTAAAETTKETPVAVKLNIPDVPGVTPHMGAPIRSRNKPKILNPAKPRRKGFLFNRFIDGQITDIANNQSI